MKSLSLCLPKHLQPRLKKQASLEAQLLSCLPEHLKPHCELVMKEGQIILYAHLAHHLMALRHYTEALKDCLAAHPSIKDASLTLRVKPKH